MAQSGTVTLLFTDLVNSTELLARIGDEHAQRIFDAHHKLLSEAVTANGGAEVKWLGDGLMVAFPSAADAVRCAIAMQQGAARAPGERLSLRVGLHVGEAVKSERDFFGTAVVTARRLCERAGAGQILCSALVAGLLAGRQAFSFRDLGLMELKGFSTPVAACEVLYDGAAAALPSAAPSPRETRAVARTSRRALAAGAGALLIAAAAMFAVVRSRSTTSAPPARAAPAAHAIRSLAVLPLDNFSGDPRQEYFADGMTDELTTDLASISGLRVISRGSAMRYKGAQRPPTPEIARALNVDAVIEGSVMREGDRVRITAQLIDAPNDRHLWAKSYERDTRDVLALQDEVALAIAREVNVQLTPDERARFGAARPVNPEAYDAYLKGRFFFSTPTDENLKQALAQFQRAVNLDPDFAPAYSGLSDSYSFVSFTEGLMPATEGMPKARAAAQKAVLLDDNLAEAHASMASVIGGSFLPFDFARGEREFRRAIALNPNYAYAHDQFGLLLAEWGRLDEALVQNRKALELDPLSPIVPLDMVFTLAWQGNYEEATAQGRKAEERDPTYYLSHLELGWISLQQGNPKAAISELEKAAAMDPDPSSKGLLGYAYAASGDRARGNAMIDEMRQQAKQRFVSPLYPAWVYIGLGDRDRALEGIAKAIDAGTLWLAWSKMDRIYDPLRSDLRFIALQKKMNLPQ